MTCDSHSKSAEKSKQNLITPAEAWDEYMIAYGKWEKFPCQQTKLDKQRASEALQMVFEEAV